MKKLLLLSALTLSTGLSFAQEVGRVLSSTPLVQQVSVPRQVCNTQQVAVQPAKSGAGALIGAIAGGAMGNAVGGGSGRAAATALGLFGGAILGDHVEGNGQTQYQNVQNCSTQSFYENRTVAYNVVYEYNGRQYNVQLAQDPGPTIPLQVTPVGSSAPVRAPNQAMSDSGYYQPQPMVQQEAYPVQAPAQWYQATPYVRPYVPISVDLNFGYSRGGHWR